MSIGALPKVCSNLEQVQRAFFEGGGRAKVNCHPSLVENDSASNRLPYAHIETWTADSHARLRMTLDGCRIGNTSHFGKMLAAFSSHAMTRETLEAIGQRELVKYFAS